MPIERPSQAPSEVPSLDEARRDFNAALGIQGQEIPDSITDEQAKARQDALIENHQFDSISDLMEYNALKYERNRTRIHNEHAQRGAQNLTEAQRAEAIVVNQAETYHIYLDNALHQVQEMMDLYHARKATAHPSAIELLAAKEGQAALYLQGLSGAMNERTAFSNVALAMNILAGDLSQPERVRVQRMLDAAKRNPALSTESKRALDSGNSDTMKRQMNVLNQRMIDILAGSADIEGVEKGFFPQQLYLDLLYLEYSKTLEDQLALIRTGKVKEELVSDIERRAEGDTIPGELHNLYENAQEWLKSQQQKIDEKGAERRAITVEILEVSDALSTYQVETAELVTAQRMFGKIQDPEAEGSVRDSTPDNVRSAIAENMDERKNFHLGRLEAFSETLEEEVLSVTIPDRIEDLSNKQLRPLVRQFSKGIADLLTYPLPEILRGQVYNFLAGDLDRALGIPVGKSEEEWTDEERATIIERMKSIKNAVDEFDREKITQFNETIDLIRKMPSASNFLNQEVSHPLPAGRVTAEEVEKVVADPTNPDNKGAEILARLFAQLEGDIGDPDAENPTGLLGESQIFLKKVDENIDIHLEVGKALREQGKNYWKIALAILGIAAAGYVLPKVARRVRFRSPSSRIAHRLNRNPGFKAVQFADDAERSLNAIRGLRAERLFAEGRNIANLRAAIEQAHAIRPTGFRGSWARADIAGKWRILRNAGFKSKEIRYLLENGWCGRSGSEVAELLVRNGHRVPQALRAEAMIARGARSPMVRTLQGGLQDASLVGREAAAVRTATHAREFTAAESAAARGWAAASPMNRVIWGGAIALEAVALGMDSWALKESYEFYKENQERIRKQLDGLVSSKVLVKVGDDKYEFRSSGGEKLATITMKDIQSDAAVNANWARVGTDAVALASLISMGPKAFAGPPGWILIGVEVAIHVGINAWERDKYRDFVNKMPPEVLALFGGTAGLLGMHEHGLIEDNFSDFIVELFDEEKSPEYRKKLFFSVFVRSLMSRHPDVYSDIMMGGADVMRQLYEQDFDTVVLPMLKSQMLINTERADMSFTAINELDLDRDFIGVSQKSLERSVENAADFYVSHFYEDMFLRIQKRIEETESPTERALLQRRLYQIGSRRIFGRRLLDVQDELAQNGGKTRAELLSTRFHQTLQRASARTRSKTWRGIMNRDIRGYGAGADGSQQFIAEYGRVTTVNPFGADTVRDEPLFSYNRNFYVSKEGIHGLPGREDRIWFNNSDVYFDTYEGSYYPPRFDTVRYAAGRIPDSYRLRGFPSLYSKARELEALKKSLPGKDRQLRAHQLELSRAMREMDEDSGINAATLQLIQTVETEVASYMSDIQYYEEQIVAFRTFIEKMSGDSEAFRSQGTFEEGLSQFWDVPELTKELYPDAEGGYPVIFTPHSENLDGNMMRQMVLFEAQLQSNNPYEHLFAVHFQKQELRNGTEQYLATFVYTNNKTDLEYNSINPSEDKEDYSYVQVAFEREENASTLEVVGLPVYTYRGGSLPKKYESDFLGQMDFRLEQQQQSRTIERLGGMSTAERIYRAGNVGGIVQIEDNLWGIRTGGNAVRGPDGMFRRAPESFFVIRLNPETGEYEVKRMDRSRQGDWEGAGGGSDDPRERIDFRENTRRAVSRFDAQREGVDIDARELTDGEKNFARAMEEALKGKEWITVTPEISKLIGLQGNWQNQATRLPDEALSRIRQRGERFEDPNSNSENPNAASDPNAPMRPRRGPAVLQDILNQPNLVADPRAQRLSLVLQTLLAPNPQAKDSFFAALQQEIEASGRPIDQMNYDVLMNILGAAARKVDDAEGTNLYEPLSILPR